MASENDVLLCFSTSGKSKNIINALKKAQSMDLKAFLITGDKYINEVMIFFLL